jgi:hypothetical protein
MYTHIHTSCIYSICTRVCVYDIYITFVHTDIYVSMCVCLFPCIPTSLARRRCVSSIYMYTYTLEIHGGIYVPRYVYTYLFRETAVGLFNPLERYQFLPPHSLLDAHLQSVRDLRKCREDEHHPVPLGRQLANSLDNLIPGSVCVCVCLVL